jgi:hypothetical protein
MFLVSYITTENKPPKIPIENSTFPEREEMWKWQNEDEKHIALLF